MNSKRSIFLVLLVAAAIAGCATSQPVRNMIDQPVPPALDGSPRDLQQVRLAIAEGCRAKLWRPVEVSGTEIKCSILVRGKHYAEVNIPYSQNAYSIIYSDSRVLDYDDERRRIHRNYNKWVVLLEQSIQQQFATG